MFQIKQYIKVADCVYYLLNDNNDHECRPLKPHVHPIHSTHCLRTDIKSNYTNLGTKYFKNIINVHVNLILYITTRLGN